MLEKFTLSTDGASGEPVKRVLVDPKWESCADRGAELVPGEPDLEFPTCIQVNVSECGVRGCSRAVRVRRDGNNEEEVGSCLREKMEAFISA